MPIVRMPDGTEVEMPDHVSPEQQARLRALIASQHAEVSVGEKFAKGEAHTAIPDAPQQPKGEPEKPNDPVNFTTGNLNKGIAGGVGAPVDVAQDVVNLGKAAIGTAATAMGRSDLAPEIRKDAIGGSKWIENLMRQHKLITDAAIPTSPAGKAAAQALQMGGNVAGGAAVSSAAVRTAAKVEGAVWDLIDKPAATGIIKGEEPITTTIRESRRAGFVFPPTQVNPSATNKVLEGIGGKVMTRQEASLANAETANNLAKSDLGVSKNTPLSTNTIELVRDDANAVYNKVRAIEKPFALDGEYVKNVKALNGEFAALEAKFPGLTKNPEVDELKQLLVNEKAMTSGLTADEAVDLTRLLRNRATANYKAATGVQPDPEKLALAQAQREAAGIAEDLIARNLKSSGKEALYNDWVDARKKIAISHDIESALNPATGNISENAVAALARKGRPLTGGLEKIANFARAAPHAAQTPERVGGVPQGVIDTLFTLMGVGAGGAAGGIPGSLGGAAAGALARPLTRQIILSKWYQDHMLKK